MLKNRKNKIQILPTTSVPQIEFYGREQVVVEECNGVSIAEYDNETIKLLAGSHKIRFYGKGLNLKNLTPQSVRIIGIVSSLEFEE